MVVKPLVSLRLTVMPVLGAFADNVTVAITILPPVTLDSDRDTEATF